MLPARAAETLAMLVFVLMSSALSLVPQDIELLGAEILVIAVPLTVVSVRNQLKFQRQNPDSPLQWSVSRVTASGVALFPGTIAGISLAAHWGGGLYWLAPTVLLGIAGAVYSAWVLLVEIVR
jgi:modulator of FtsH protease